MRATTATPSFDSGQRLGSCCRSLPRGGPMWIAEDDLVHARLKTPRAAAVAGIVFSLLMFAIFALLRPSIPDDPLASGAWLVSNTKRIALALNLVPFAGVAFLWSVGVLRDRLDRHEDRFFATVFLG